MSRILSSTVARHAFTSQFASRQYSPFYACHTQLFYGGQSMKPLICLLLVLAFSTSHAQWIRINSGLPDAAIRTFVVSGSTIFAGGDSGVYRSTDIGSSWSAAKTGLAPRIVYALAINSTDLFAGTSAGVYRTTNNGGNWIETNTGMLNYEWETPFDVFAFATKPTGSGKSDLLAGASGDDYNSGVFRFVDSSASWIHYGPKSTSLDYVCGLAVVPDGAGGTILCAGTYEYGVFMAGSPATVWTSINSGFPSNHFISALARCGTTLFAAANHTGSHHGSVWLRKITDTSWSVAASGLTGTYVNALMAEGLNLFAATDSGVYLSSNTGATWAPIGNELRTIRVYSLGMSGTSLFAGTASGAYRYALSVPPWKFTNTGINHTVMVQHSVNPNINGAALAPGDHIGVFYDSNGTLTCGGYERWTGSGNVALAAFGDNPTTAVKDGFAGGELFTWRIWRQSDGWAFTAFASYVTPGGLGGLVTDTSKFTANGITALASLSANLTNVSEEHLPSQIMLHQNYPNPFNPKTTITFGLPERTRVSLTIYNTLGELVGELAGGDREAGYHTVTFDAANLASGVYLYRLQAGSFVETRKLLVLR